MRNSAPILLSLAAALALGACGSSSTTTPGGGQTQKPRIISQAQLGQAAAQEAQQGVSLQQATTQAQQLAAALPLSYTVSYTAGGTFVISVTNTSSSAVKVNLGLNGGPEGGDQVRPSAIDADGLDTCIPGHSGCYVTIKLGDNATFTFKVTYAGVNPCIATVAEVYGQRGMQMKFTCAAAPAV